mmetsp:Transcript_52072/g.122047  ORF Transcript_52072/g.122047 Transcript_52072/m.122047 type:complete len:176 (+) Transcript_52072:510-1037(+)
MLLLDSSVENTWDATENMRLLCFNLTRAISINEPGVEKIVVFIHLYNFGLRTCPSMKVSLETTRMVLHHFPERLGHCILYRPPRVFGGFFRAILPFVDPVTRDKIRVINGSGDDGSENDLLLRQIIGPDWKKRTGVDQPAQPGCSPGYDHEEYWPKVEEWDAQQQEKLREMESAN